MCCTVTWRCVSSYNLRISQSKREMAPTQATPVAALLLFFYKVIVTSSTIRIFTSSHTFISRGPMILLLIFKASQWWQKPTRCQISWRLGCHTRPGSWKCPNGDLKIKSSLLKSVHGHFQVVVVLLMLIYRLQGSARNCDASLCQCACACASVSTSRTSSAWALGQNIRTSLCSA